MDEFIQLFAQEGDPELVGIGASVRGGNEWFEGPDAIREIIESDWTYWGDVWIDVDRARIRVMGDVAGISSRRCREVLDLVQMQRGSCRSRSLFAL